MLCRLQNHMTPRESTPVRNHFPLHECALSRCHAKLQPTEVSHPQFTQGHN